MLTSNAYISVRTPPTPDENEATLGIIATCSALMSADLRTCRFDDAFLVRSEHVVIPPSADTDNTVFLNKLHDSISTVEHVTVLATDAELLCSLRRSQSRRTGVVRRPLAIKWIKLCGQMVEIVSAVHGEDEARDAVSLGIH